MRAASFEINVLLFFIDAEVGVTIGLSFVTDLPCRRKDVPCVNYSTGRRRCIPLRTRGRKVSINLKIRSEAIICLSRVCFISWCVST